MPIWSLEELNSAASELYIFKDITARESEAEVAQHYSLWDGLARYILQKVSAIEQGEINSATTNCRLTAW